MSFVDTGVTDNYVDLGYNSRLLSFTIGISSASIATFDNARQNIFQQLSTIVSTDIQEVSIRDVVDYPIFDNVLNFGFCSALAVLLKKRPFLNLRRVVIYLSDFYGRVYKERAIRKELGDFEERGMLCVLGAVIS